MSEFIVIGQRAEDGIAIDFSKPAVGELVRCKDCKWWNRKKRTCELMAIIPPSKEWYCGSGVRNGKEQEYEVDSY